jgi:hypothetical protein
MTRKLSVARLDGTLFETVSLCVLDSTIRNSDRIDLALDPTETPP